MESILLRLAYVAIETALTFASANHIPQSDMVREKYPKPVVVCHILQRRIDHVPHETPKLVLGVSVILRLCQ
jgi:hypothetical protein